MTEENINRIDDLYALYENSVVLVTGGTGFLGKVLVEKLLRTFRIGKVFLLIRTKNGMSATDRLNEYCKESVFDRIRTDMPAVLNKLVAISASFDGADLNIPDESMTMLQSEVEVIVTTCISNVICSRFNIVFNIVASVKFNEKLRDAVDINVIGTKKILDLAMEMTSLKAFLHISTLYSNCNRKTIGEKVYDQDIGYEKIIQLLRSNDDVELEKIQTSLLADMPNTYTMTKRCSEALVNHRAHCLPAAIFRPPIVLPTYKEPVRGWTDNLYGPSGLCAGTARGFIHAIYGNRKKKANLVPADYCVNAMITVAWDTHRKFSERQLNHAEIPVYNYIFDKNNLTWGEYMRLVKCGLHEPLDKAFWYFSYTIISTKWLYNIVNFVCHTIPGYILDAIAGLCGRKQIYTKGYKKLCRVIIMMSYFGLRDWNFQNNNIDRLSTEIQRSSNEENELEFDMKTIDWKEYFLFYLPGIKKYFFKENYSLLQQTRRHYQRLHAIHVFLKYSFWMSLFSSSTYCVWKYIIKFIFQ